MLDLRGHLPRNHLELFDDLGHERGPTQLVLREGAVVAGWVLFFAGAWCMGNYGGRK